MKKIILHQAHTPPYKSVGSTGFGVTERSVIESVVPALKDRLTKAGCEVIVYNGTNLVRQEADLFLAPHCDGNKSDKPRGFGVYTPKLQTGHYKAQSQKFERLLENVYAVDTGIPHKDRDTRDTDFYYGFDFFPKSPACLIEMGFITNGDDFEILAKKQKLVVDGIYRAIIQFLGITQEPHPDFAEAWRWGKENGILSQSSNPNGVLTDERMIMFLKRYHDKFNS